MEREEVWMAGVRMAGKWIDGEWMDGEEEKEKGIYCITNVPEHILHPCIEE